MSSTVATITFKTPTAAVVEVDSGDRGWSITRVEVRPATTRARFRRAVLTQAGERTIAEKMAERGMAGEPVARVFEGGSPVAWANRFDRAA
jgi:hypothetical protein